MDLRAKDCGRPHENVGFLLAPVMGRRSVKGWDVWGVYPARKVKSRYVVVVVGVVVF